MNLPCCAGGNDEVMRWVLDDISISVFGSLCEPSLDDVECPTDCEFCMSTGIVGGNDMPSISFLWGVSLLDESILAERGAP